jgi:Protein of unknown function (DUF4241)
MRVGLTLLSVVSAMLLAGQGAFAAESGTETWIKAQNWTTLRIVDAGTVTPSGTEMIGVDSLTFASSYAWPWFTVPGGPARFVAFFDDKHGRVSKVALIFADGVPACGHDVGSMGVDTGTGAFLDRVVAQKLDDLSGAMGVDCNLYDCFMAKQVGEHAFAQMIRLPDGTSFPAFSTGWGDGVYPVATLHDAEGQMLAVYADFMGRNETGEWLLPEPCTSPKRDPTNAAKQP